MNLNDLSNKITNFKIKFTKNPDPIQVSNMKLIFLDEGQDRLYSFKDIRLNNDEDTVEVILENGMVR